ncbi:hypothetical protein AA0114_g10824 [Alternaria tenuissima]|uniref:Uncharacterized protein n=1 Tax=Alternaria tenuissima TaxID=119927 RepID=A0A4V1WLG9_9PLEO|nr:hypothetical protein AA0114_g10824 [Alternaria tenuissima]
MSLDGKRLFSESPEMGVLSFDASQKCTLINAFWPYLNLSEDDFSEQQYEALLESWEEMLQELYPYRNEFATQEWNGMLGIIVRLDNGPDDDISDLMRHARTNFLNTSEFAIACSIELAVRLQTGVNVRSGGLLMIPGQESSIEWPEYSSLKEAIDAGFDRHETLAQSEQYSLFDESFTVTGLKDRCRLKIVWTNSLTDHLKLLGPRGKRELLIYKNKTSLLNHQQDRRKRYIPEDLLHETIRTLDLLFPIHDRHVLAFLEKEDVQMPIEDPLKTPRATQLSEFSYWNNRLARLLRLYDGPPEGRLQALLDTRDSAQFATLWVAVFGVTSLTILFGVLSTVYSAKQYHVARDSYKLALAQACHQTSPPLPGYCT